MRLDSSHEMGGKEGFPNLLALLLPRSNAANCPGSQILPDCRCSKSNTPSKIPIINTEHTINTAYEAHTQ